MFHNSSAHQVSVSCRVAYVPINELMQKPPPISPAGPTNHTELPCMSPFHPRYAVVHCPSSIPLYPTQLQRGTTVSNATFIAGRRDLPVSLWWRNEPLQLRGQTCLDRLIDCPLCRNDMNSRSSTRYSRRIIYRMR